MVDWAATGAMLSGIGAISGAGAIMVAAIVGRNAIQDYRAQKLAEREIEHAETILTLAYRAKTALSHIRNPMIDGNELENSESELKNRDFLSGLTDDKKRAAISANVYFMRARSHDVLFRETFEALPFAKAYFGDEVFDGLQSLVKKRHEVLVFAQAYGDGRSLDDDFRYQVESTIWEGYGKVRDGDKVAEQIEASIADLERRLLPVIRMAPRRRLSISVG